MLLISGIIFLLLPLGFKLEYLRPIAAGHFGDVRLGCNCRAPADGIADDGLVVGAKRHFAVGPERGLDGQSFEDLGELVPSVKFAFFAASARKFTVAAFCQYQLVGYSLYFAR